MIARQDFERIEGATAYDNSGEKIGRIGQLDIDEETGEASWVTVFTACTAYRSRCAAAGCGVRR